MTKSRSFNSLLVAAAVGVVSAGSTSAMAQVASTDQPEMQPPSNQRQVVSKCTQLIGSKVENREGQPLGKITDAVVSFDNERVSYCVLSVNHGIFAKSKYLAVPLAAFRPSEDGTHLILNVSKVNLAKAKGFDRNEWPSAITPVWAAEPAPPVELPPVEVFAPAAAPAPVLVRPYVADPVWGPLPTPRTASDAINEMTTGVMYGWPVR